MEHCQVKCIVAGTTNPAKIAALRELVAPHAEIVEPLIPGRPLFDEVGKTVAEVAAGKARAWSEWLVAHDVRLPVIVTDGGLTIPALADRWDPTRTRRFAGEGLTLFGRAQALLELTSGLLGNDRQIGWIEAAAIAQPDGDMTICTAESPPGMLATTARPEDLQGSNGFWVPAVWLCPEFGMKRLVDLTAEERSRRLNHWDRLGEAIRNDLQRDEAP
jgi:inosine/xanthosine triphosphate pyrophosphatase family protein